ncbi:MAG: hypothetical protein ACREIC_07825, partial [Limisphaerales bacterium]
SLGNAEVKAQVIALLRQKVFGGWPAEPVAPQMERVDRQNKDGMRYDTYRLTTQSGINLDLFILSSKGASRPQKVLVTILGPLTRTASPDNPSWSGWSPEGLRQLKQNMKSEKSAFAFFAPRAVTTEAWMNDPKKFTQVRRRYMLLGQTLDSMRVWDIRCAVQAIKSLPELKSADLTIRSEREMGVNSAYAALFEPGVTRLDLSELPQSHMQGPDYLNVLKICDIPQLLEMLGERARCRVN